jgi:hypothetical protein
LGEGRELLVGGAGLQLAEQRPDVEPADAAEDAVQDGRERLVAGEDMAADRNLQHLFGCHVFPSFG